MKKKLNRRFDSSVAKKTLKSTTLRLEALESRELLSATETFVAPLPLDYVAAQNAPALGAIDLSSVAAAESNAASSQTWRVTSTADSGSGTLRYALANAAAGDTITFASTLQGKTITLNSELTITKSITIDASNLWNATDETPGITVSGGDATRILYIESGDGSDVYYDEGELRNYSNVEVTINGITFTNGRSSHEDYDENSGVSYYGYGGAIHNNARLSLDNCVIRDSKADLGGGIFCRWLGETSFTNCTITNNTIFGYDGYGNGGGAYFESTGASFTNCSITNNTAPSGSGGGIMVAEAYAPLTLTNCVVEGNEAEYDGGGIYLFEASTKLVDCLVVGNSARYGGGLSIEGSDADLYNSTVVGNTANGSWEGDVYDEGHGGGFWIGEDYDNYSPAELNAYNSIILNNVAGDGPDVCLTTYTGQSGNSNDYPDMANTANAYNTLSSFTAWTSGANNLTYNASKPLFTNAAAGDYTLARGSQVVDKGNNQYVTASVDLAGNARVSGAKVDLGAYEYSYENQPEVRSTVVTTADDGYDYYDGKITLREALLYALPNATITFASSLKGKTIALDPELGELTIDKSITIDASNLWNATTSAPGLTVSGQGASGILYIDGNASGGESVSSIAVEIDAITLTGGLGGDGNMVYGGAICNFGATLSLNSCVLRDNESRGDGGAVGSANGETTFTDCVITNNTAGSCGGGVCSHNSVTAFVNCTITNNTATYGAGGAIFSSGVESLSLENCVVSDNRAENSSGGGIFFSNADETLSLNNCVISSNVAGSGGGLSFYGAANLYNCKITDNSAVHYFDEEGRIINGGGGGILVDGGGGNTFVATNCLVAGNSAYFGGGLEIYDIPTNLYNCTVVNNTAEEGGGVELDMSSSLNAYNTIIAGNSATSGVDVHHHVDYYGDVYSVANAYNTLSSFTAWTSGANNLTYNASKPLFTNAAAGDYTLAANSQALNKGDNQNVSTTVDLAGNPRISDGTVDLGAYERPVGPVPLATPVLTVADTANTAITVAWNAIPNASRYSLSYRLKGTSTWTNKNVGTNVSYTVSGLTSNTEYDFRLKAVGDETNYKSVYSAILSAKTDANPVPPLDVPTALRETAKTETSVTVAWDAVANASGYKIAWRDKADSANSYITVDAATTSYKLTGLDNSASYYWKVQALGDGSDYSSSAYTAARTVTPRQKLVAPTLSASGESNGIAVSWDAVPHASRYYLSYKPANSSTWSSNVNVGTNLSYTITGLAATGEYDVRVKAIGNNFDYSTSDYGTATVALQNTEPRSTVVTTNLDVVNPTDGQISLREALNYAASGATVTFDAALRGKTFTLSSPLNVTKSATIDASSLYDAATNSLGVAISGGGSTRIMQIAQGKSVLVKSVAFVSGAATDEGGAVLNNGSLTVENCVFTGNSGSQVNPEDYSAFLYGAVIAVKQGGTFTATGSSFVGNVGASAITVENGEISLVNCLVRGNDCAGVYVGTGSEASMTYCAVVDNNRNGILVGEGGVLTATNCLVAGNVAYYGAGIELYGTANLYNCTVAGNGAYYCGGGVDLDKFGVLNSYNTIIAGNYAGSTGADLYSVYDAPVANAYNTLSSYVAWTSGANNVTYDGTKPLFTDAESGNFTLVNKSQAINKGANEYVSTSYDFAGNPRIDVISGTVDIGAYESLRPNGPIVLDAPVLSVADRTGTTLTVAWDAVPNAERYSLSYRLAGETSWKSVNVGTNLSYTVTGLTTNADYELQLKAIGDGTLYKSVYSAIIVGTPSEGAAPLPTPVLSIAGKTDTTISVSWNAVENAEGYRVSYKLATASVWTTVNVGTKTGSLITGLKASTNYDVRVEALGDGANYANALSATQRVKTTAKPAAPAPLPTPVLSVADTTGATVTVSWDAIPNATRYGVSYKLASATTWTNKNVGQNTSYTIEGLDANAEYDVRVKAIGDDVKFKSVYSPTVRVQTDATGEKVPLATPVLSVANKSETTVDVSWDPVAHVERYSLFYRPSNTTSWTIVNLGTETNYKMTGLTPETEYDVRLKAVGDDVNYTSSFSAILKVQTNATPDGPVQLATPVPHVAEKTATTITAAWDAVPNASEYRFIWKNQSDASFSSPIFLDAATTSYQLTGLDNSATYVWKVLAIGDGVVYLNSEYCATQRDKPQQTLETPTLTLSATANSLTASWTAVPNVERYSLSFRVAGTTNWTNVNAGANRSYTVTGLSAGVQYEARVKAIGDGVDYKSVYSAIVRSGSTSSAVVDADADVFEEFFDELAEEDLDLLAANFGA